MSAWGDAIHPQDAGRSVEVYTAAFDRRVPFELEYRLRRRDAAYRWIVDQGVPRFHADGAFAGYIGSAVDVTERKRAEEALSMVSRRLIEAQEAERKRLARELHDDISQRLTIVVSLCLFRVLQEALQNAIKHSGSRNPGSSRAREIKLTVSIGPTKPPAMSASGLGLTSMRERLKLVDGELSIDSKPGGTTVRARARSSALAAAPSMRHPGRDGNVAGPA